MSHFIKGKTQYRDRETLVAALCECGFTQEQIRVHETAQHLYGYRGDRRPQKAHVILPRKYVGSSSNDIGFFQEEDGTYTAIISAYDQNRYGKPWQAKLRQEYGKHKALKELTQLGLRGEATKLQDGRYSIRAQVPQTVRAGLRG